MTTASRLNRRQFVVTAISAGGAALLPKSALAARSPNAAAPPSPPQGFAGKHERVLWKLQPFPIKQVRLSKGPFKEAMERDHQYLDSLPSDRLLHTFRLAAGVPSSAEPLGGWEKPDCELRGHFTGGHYLSACALMYASTGDDTLKSKGDAMVAELAQLQKAHGNGYLSAFPEELFDRLRDGKGVWAPFYTIHKIMAGQLDMYQHCGNERALEVAEGMARWVGHWAWPLSDAHMARVLQTEFGGMNEVLYNLYAVTGKEEYLDLGHRFDHEAVFGPLAAYRDELKGLHANTNVPKIIGAARRYELTGEYRYHEIADYFWHEVTGRRAYCTGGTSNGEHWNTEPGKLASELSVETQECCVSYNLLKLARHLFGWTGDPRTMDYYERTLFNSRLGTQNPEDGMMMYFVPLSSGYWKFYNSSLRSFWCCTGTGVEEFAKLADSIYFHDADGVYVNLFIASELDWREKGIRLRQETNFPEQEGTTLMVETGRPVQMTLNIRIPCWATRGGQVKLNGAPLPAFAGASSYLSLSREWRNGDRVEVSLPMSLHLAPLPDDETVQAAMYGPLVLAGRLGTANLTRAMMYGEYNPAPKGEPVPAPEIKTDGRNSGGWVEPVPNQALTFRTVGQSAPLTLIPLCRLFGERYAVYWKVRKSAA